MRRELIGLMLVVLISPRALAEEGAPDAPWWKREKIRFFWGQWGQHAKAGVSMSDVIGSASRVGATVFVTGKHRADEDGPSGFNIDHARLARARGVRYFAGIYGSYLRERGAKMDAPLAVTAKGNPYFGYGRYTKIPMHCPLHGPLYEQHLLEPMLSAAATGLVDGVLLDWEPYERPEPGVCYCDSCFAAFATKQGTEAGARDIEAAARQPWLEKRKLAGKYVQNHHQRRVAMFRGIRERIHEVKADFVFAGYDLHDWPMRAGLHSTRVPFFVIDMRHYFEDHTRPWWQSYHAHERGLGYIHIAGSYNITFFGYQPDTDVSAAQWMYDAAINTDGTWLWFEEELGPEMWRSFWTADRRIRATERKVGKFLLAGRQDPHFALPIEWSGDPQLTDKIIQRTYHLGDQHLMHVNNVDTDRPAQVRVRFPRLPAGSQWIVRDPISELTYTHDYNQTVWSRERLDRGIIVTLEKRSELFLRLDPAKAGEEPEADATISGRLSAPMPDHAKTHKSAPAADTRPAPRSLVYTRTEDMGYQHSGKGTGWSLANAIWATNDKGEGNGKLRQLKGYLWSPVWSPDGSRIALCHYANGRGQIYVMGADGARAVNVSNNSHCDRSPVWSPDSGKLAFVSDRGGNWDICVMNGDGSGQTQLTAGPGCNRAPAWSPDGRTLAFESNRGGDVDIYLSAADGANQRPVARLPGDQKEPTWSPDGSEIAYVGLGWVYPDLSIASVRTGRIRAVVEGITHVGSPRWSPDGSRIAGVYRKNTWGKPQISAIFVVDPNEYSHLGHDDAAANSRTLVRGAATAPHHAGRRDPSFIPSWYSNGSASPRWVVKVFSGLAWSPDGKQLAFSSNIAEDGYFHVYTIAAQGGPPRMVPDTTSAWPQAVDWSEP